MSNDAIRATSRARGRIRRLPQPRNVPLANRSLLRDRVRLGISVGGLGFAVLLVLLLRGIMDGTVARATSYVDHVGAGVFVAAPGVRNMAMAASALPDSTVGELAADPAVESATGILRTQVMATASGGPMPAVLIAYQPGTSPGGPWAITHGRALREAGEAVVDSVLANDLRASVGSEISVAGKQLRVVGLSGETAALAGKMLFVSLHDGQEILRVPGTISFVLLKLGPGVDASTFARQLSAEHPEFSVQTRSELAKNDRTVLGQLFVAPIDVMSTAGLLVGLAIVGLTMYTTTAERMRDWGVLKAIGAPNAYLLRVVVTQALALGIIGFGAGVIAVYLAGPLVSRIVPEIGVQVGPRTMAKALGEVLGMSLAGAIIPIARVVRADPLIVFRR